MCAVTLVYLQYTSMILIILTFITGTLSVPAPQALHPVALQVPAPQPTPAALRSRHTVNLTENAISFSPTFDAQGKLIADDTLRAIEAVVARHDVSAEIELLASEGEFAGATLRAIEIHRFLRASGVPPRAVRVFVVLSSTPLENLVARCSFTREES